MIRSTGIVRRVDELGRVVVPVELRRVLGLGEGTPVEIFTHGETVLLRRYEPLCVFCGHWGEEMVELSGRQVCASCRSHLSAPRPVA